jgi:hypothetical protein
MALFMNPLAVSLRFDKQTYPLIKIIVKLNSKKYRFFLNLLEIDASTLLVFQELDSLFFEFLQKYYVFFADLVK